jgi:tetratricopeptide (TPR) repeat protein
MRAPIAPAIYVCLVAVVFTGSCFAGGPAEVRIKPPDNILSDSSAPDWIAVYKAALAASDRRSDEEALGLFERNWDTASTSGERGASADGLGQTFRRLGRLNEAKSWMERARHEFSVDPNPGSKLAVTASELADLYRTTGEYDVAERLLRDVLVSPSNDAESTVLLRNTLASLLREEGRSAEAQPLFQASIDLGNISWRQRAGALIGLADIDREQGSWEASIDRWNQALEICRREKDERAEAIVLRGLGTTWLSSGAVARAEPLLRRSLQMMETAERMPPEDIATAHSSLAELYRSENKLALAEDEWSRALQIDRPILGETHPQVAVLMEMLSDVYSARGRFELARDYATRASETMRGSFGENSMPVATALTNQAAVEERASDRAAAARDYERAIRIARLYPEHRSLQDVMIRRYAGLLKAMHRQREARALLSQRTAQASVFPVK